MTVAERIAAVTRCRELVHSYHRAIDDGRATAAMSAFADCAEFQAHGRLLRGHSEIMGFLTAREANTERQTVHVFANESVTDDGSDRVELQAVVLVHVRQPDGRYLVDGVFEVTHQLVNVDGQWRITRRISVPLHSQSRPKGPSL